MSQIEQLPKCGRCNGSGMHTHGVCYGCNGLGIAPMTDYLPYKKNVDAAVSELALAEKIILAMLNAMTAELKILVASKLDADGVVDEGTTRYHERRAALAAFGK
jgi:hypothetical protein